MRRRLAYLVPTLIILASVISAFLMYLLATRNLHQVIEKQSRVYVDASMTYLQNVLNTQLATDTLQDAKATISSFSLQPDFKKILLVNGEDQILLANRANWEGTSAVRIPGYSDETAESVIRLHASNLQTNLERQVVQGYYPIILKIGAQGVGSEQNGLLYVEYDISHDLAQAKFNVFQQSLVFGFLLICSALIVALILHKLISVRVDSMIAAAKRFAKGNFDEPLKVIGHDELSELGVALNEMAEQRKIAEDSLRVAATAFETHEAIMITDAEARIIKVNQAFEKITGYKAEEVIGMNPRILSSGKHDKEFFAQMWRELIAAGSWTGELWDRSKFGNIYPKEITITAVKNETGETTQYVAIFSDITSRKKTEEEIHNLAFYDALTGLPNRRLLIERLNLALAVSSRSHQYGALMFLDLDNFKTINDVFGHDYGDALLAEVASRLKHSVRDVDTVARLGGDEFIVLIENVSADEHEASQNVAQFAEKIRAVLATDYQLNDQTHHSSPSIGVTLFCGNQTSVDDLVKRADMAMYQAKDSGRNRVRFFDPQLQRSVETRAVLEADLRRAITENQLHLYYQIQLDQDLKPIGAEALIRWIHPKRGMVSPSQFIPVAEESSLILEIGLWVLDAACQQLADWSKDEKTRDLILAVNVSAEQFRQADFVELVKTMIDKHHVNPSQLKLELTESVALDDLDFVIAKMLALKEVLKVRLSLDDFGTGYSSLSYLKKLPLNQIKIDQSFVRDMKSNAGDAVMVKTIIDLARNFGMEVIAEGVETDEQLAILRQFGCSAYQGYLFSKPVPIGEFKTIIKQF